MAEEKKKKKNNYNNAVTSTNQAEVTQKVKDYFAKPSPDTAHNFNLEKESTASVGKKQTDEKIKFNKDGSVELSQLQPDGTYKTTPLSKEQYKTYQLAKKPTTALGKGTQQDPILNQAIQMQQERQAASQITPLTPEQQATLQNEIPLTPEEIQQQGDIPTELGLNAPKIASAGVAAASAVGGGLVATGVGAPVAVPAAAIAGVAAAIWTSISSIKTEQREKASLADETRKNADKGFKLAFKLANEGRRDEAVQVWAASERALKISEIQLANLIDTSIGRKLSDAEQEYSKARATLERLPYNKALFEQELLLPNPTKAQGYALELMQDEN